jgi:propanol-preferring alcohol dehydrogenase
MRAMVLEQTRTPLIMREQPTPEPKGGEILVEIAACGVCRTDLHVVDGELPHPKLPIVPGHEIVGRIAAIGSGVAGFAAGDRAGVPWLGRNQSQFRCAIAVEIWPGGRTARSEIQGLMLQIIWDVRCRR